MNNQGTPRGQDPRRQNPGVRRPAPQNTQRPAGQAQPPRTGTQQPRTGGQTRRPQTAGRQTPPRTAPDPAQLQAELARRRALAAERERRRIQEENRRREQRRRSVRVFFGRLLVFFIILVLLAAIGVGIFFLCFNHTDEPADPPRVSYYFGGEEGEKLDEALARQNGVLYVDFHAAASYLGLSAVGGGDSMRYIITDTETDSAGDGTEEDVIFHADQDLAIVNGQQIRLDGKAILHGDHYLVPLSFISTYMQGVTVNTENRSVSVSRIFRDAEGKDPLPVSFTLKTEDPLPQIPDTDPDLPVTEPPVTPPDTPDVDLTVEFKSDLSAYEAYMNPADRDGFLLLVNAENLLSSEYLPAELTDLADTRKDGRNTQKMVKTAAMALEAMFIELRANGYTDVSVTSAYRSYSYQSTLFNMYTDNELKKNPSLSRAEAEAITETYSARPGTSEHQSGLCCDMHNLGSADQAFANKAAYKWLKDNCWKFGFIIRFPEGKEDITGISFEPWHYRFVGRYHAKAIYDSGLCLEEYLKTLE